MHHTSTTGRATRRVGFVTVAALIGALFSMAAPISASATPTTYYVSASGSDSANGTDPSTPWRSLAKVNATAFAPGDSVLFKSGDSWTGQLIPTSSGSAGSPITFSSYGSGAKPTIDGAGAQPGTVVVTSNSFLTFTGLDIANRAATSALRSGIIVDDALTTPLTGITLTNLSIHDVSGVNYPSGAWQEPGDGAIIVTGRADSSTSRVDSLLIKDVAIDTVDDAGVRINTRNNSARATNVHVTGVTVNNAGGNGIMMGNTTGGIIEHSRVTNSGTRDGADAGIWGAMDDSPVFQYNEVSGQTTVGGDGYAFDFDFQMTNATFQYNYSHDNPRGFMQFFFQSSGTVRYNISQNDGDAAFAFYDSVSNMDIYNNTIYIQPGTFTKPVLHVGGSAPVNTFFRNNLWVNGGSGSFDADGTYDHNVVFGNHPGSDPADSNKVVIDPLLVNPGVATGPTDLGGYKLRPSSPALGAGVLISGAPATDFFGNPVSTTQAPNIGAYAGAGVSADQPGMPGIAVDDSVTGTGDRQWNYSGTWGHCQSCSDPTVLSEFARSGSYSQTAGDIASMTFIGTRATIHGIVGPDDGIAAVSIDGGAEQPVDFWAYSRLGDRAIFTSPVLSNGQHTLSVRVTGTKRSAATGTWVILDRADITRAPAVLDDTVITGTNHVTYSSGWNSCGPCFGSQGTPATFGSSNHWIGATGATATLSFTGTQASYSVVKDTNEGRVGVSVDGGTEVVIDLYSVSRIGNLSVYTTPLLPAGAHTLTVRVLGTKSPAATDTLGVVDRFDVYS